MHKDTPNFPLFKYMFGGKTVNKGTIEQVITNREQYTENKHPWMEEYTRYKGEVGGESYIQQARDESAGYPG